MSVETVFNGCSCGNSVQCCSSHSSVGEGMRPVAEFLECYMALKKQGPKLTAALVYSYLSDEVKEQCPLLTLQKIIGESVSSPKEIPESFAISFLEAGEALGEKLKVYPNAKSRAPGFKFARDLF